MIFTYRYIKKKRQGRASQNAKTDDGLPGQHRPSVFNNSTGIPSKDENIVANSNQGERQTSSTRAETGLPESGNEQNASDKQEKRQRRLYRIKLMVGLLPPFLLASLDLTVVASSLSFIASHFGKFNQLNWIVTAYSLTSTAFIPAFGQLADVFGRHSTLQFALALMVIGSTLCAAAQTWGMLLFGRALQGMAAAGCTSIISIVLADKVSLKENAKNTTIFQFVAGTSYSYGPVIGGYLTNSNWRYCFVISIPIAVAAQILIFFILRKELVPGTHSTRRSFFSGIATVDVGGTIIFIISITLIILSTSWGGATYAWKSAAVLVPLIVGAILFAVFWIYEYLLEPGRALSTRFSRQRAMIPISLFARKDITLVSIIGFVMGAALYSIFYFIGIYFILVESYDAGKSGVQLLYYIPGIGVGVYAAMFMVNVYPASTFLPLVAGTVIETVGIGLIVRAVQTRNVPFLDGMMGLTGVGTGLRFMPATLHTAGIWPTQLAPAMSLLRFALPFGGTIALTIMGSVFNNKLSETHLNRTDFGSGFSSGSSSSLGAIARLPPSEQQLVRNKGKDGIKWAFISILPILAISAVTSLLLGNVWIKERRNKTGTTDAHPGAAEKVVGGSIDEDNDTKLQHDEVGTAMTALPGAEVAETTASHVLYESYVLALIKGRKYLESRKEVSGRRMDPAVTERAAAGGA